jgi:hypothetical protein
VAKYECTAIWIAGRFGQHFVLLTEHPEAGWRVRDFETEPPTLYRPGDLPGADPASLKREADPVVSVDPHPVTKPDDWRFWCKRLRDLGLRRG